MYKCVEDLKEIDPELYKKVLEFLSAIENTEGLIKQIEDTTSNLTEEQVEFFKRATNAKKKA